MLFLAGPNLVVMLVLFSLQGRRKSKSNKQLIARYSLDLHYVLQLIVMEEREREMGMEIFPFRTRENLSRELKGTVFFRGIKEEAGKSHKTKKKSNVGSKRIGYLSDRSDYVAVVRRIQIQKNI